MITWLEHEKNANEYLLAAQHAILKDIDLDKAAVFASMANASAQLAILRHNFSRTL